VNTYRKLKVCLPSPFILGQRMWHSEVSKAAYPTRRDFVKPTVTTLRAELEAVRDAGVDVAQIDEPYLSGFCDPVWQREFDDRDSDLDFLVGCLSDVISDVTGIIIALHICHFNIGRRGTGWVNEGGDGPIIPALKSLDVQQYTLEFSIPVAGYIEVLTETPDDHDPAVVCVDCLSVNFDTPEEIAGRIEMAMWYHPKERIRLALDRGFAPHLHSG